jgi:hypothetical protein
LHRIDIWRLLMICVLTKEPRRSYMRVEIAGMAPKGMVKT